MPESQQIEFPEFVPAIALSGSVLFPHCLMPLYIFEPRYREMLRYALENDRVFCIASTPPGVDPDLAPEQIHPVTTAGLIRASVEHEDGTSHLMLQGLKRIRILEWDTTREFRVGRAEAVECSGGNSQQAVDMAAEVIDISTQLCGEGKPMSERVRDHLRGVDDTAAVADVVAHNFVADPVEKQALLETVEVTERLRRLIAHLHRLIAEDSG